MKDLLSLISDYLSHISVGAAAFFVSGALEYVDAPLREKQQEAMIAERSFHDSSEARRLSGAVLHTELRRSFSPDLSMKKAEFDAAFSAHQAKRLDAFTAAQYGLVADSADYDTFKTLYDNTLLSCMLIPLRSSLEARYRCSMAQKSTEASVAAYAASCRQDPGFTSDRIKLSEECGAREVSFSALNHAATECITTLTVVLKRSIDSKTRFVGIFGRIEYLWRSLRGQETTNARDGSSWMEALNAAKSKDCVLP